ncbi:MAG: type VI secretion system tube protein TssD [Pseudomonadota bacterium]
MPLPAYMSIKDKDGNDLTSGAATIESLGADYDPDFEDECRVWAWSASVAQDYTPGGEYGNSPRKIQPVTFVKAVDKATPLLWESVMHMNPLDTIKMRFYRSTPGAAGNEEYFMCEWTDCKLVTGRTFYDVSGMFSEEGAGSGPVLEEWGFIFKKATFEHMSASSSASFDWAKTTTS